MKQTVRHHRHFPAREKANVMGAPTRRARDEPDALGTGCAMTSPENPKLAG